MDAVAAVAGAVAALVAIFAAWFSVRSAKAAERSAEHGRATHGLSAIQEFILREYLEREFRATSAPEINGMKITLLREAKSIARDEYEQNHEQWDKASQISNLGAWQNQIAFEAAWTLNHLGAAALSGAVPLRALLAIVGDVIIDDWLLCRSWVKSYREDEKSISQMEKALTPAVHYHRRHAEWLVLIAVIWMSRSWSYPNCDLVAEWYGGMQHLPNLLQALFRADGDLMPDAVVNEVRSLTGVELSL